MASGGASVKSAVPTIPRSTPSPDPKNTELLPTKNQKEDIFALKPYEKTHRPIRTALHQAVLDGRYGQCKILVRGMCNVNTPDLNGRTALMMACLVPSATMAVKMVKLFMKFGSDINASDSLGRTALMYSCARNRPAVVTILLGESTLDVNQRDCDGSTALLHAATNPTSHVTHLLLEQKSQTALHVDARNLAGITPLLAACRDGRFVTALLLLNAGGNPLLKDLSTNRNARQWASAQSRIKKAAQSHVLPPLIPVRQRIRQLPFIQQRPAERDIVRRDTEYTASAWDSTICKHGPPTRSYFSFGHETKSIAADAGPSTSEGSRGVSAFPALSTSPAQQDQDAERANSAARRSLIARVQADEEAAKNERQGERQNRGGSPVDSSSSCADEPVGSTTDASRKEEREVSSAKLRRVAPQFRLERSVTLLHILNMRV